jgi:hypothetical protein
MFIGFGGMDLSANLLLSKSTDLSQFASFALGWCFGALGTGVLLTILLYAKRITVTPDTVTIYYPFAFRKFTYAYNEIIGHSRYPGYMVRYGSYESFYFETKDQKVFMLFDYEFYNYYEITNMVSSRTEITKISKFNYDKHTIKIIILSIVIALPLYFLITLLKSVA